VDVGSACVAVRQSPKTDVLVIAFIAKDKRELTSVFTYGMQVICY